MTAAPVNASPNTPATQASSQAEPTQNESHARKTAMRVFKGLGQLAKRIKPLLQGTPAETPMSVLTTIIDVIEVRFAPLFLNLIWLQLNLGRQAIGDTDGSAKTTQENLLRRLEIIEGSSVNRPESQLAQDIERVARCCPAQPSAM